MHIKKIAIIIFLTVLSIGSFAQNQNTTSPYSRYGLGDIHPNFYGRSAGMGGVSLGSRNDLQVNFANPASYSAVDSISFVFEAGIDGKYTTMKNSQQSEHNHNVNLQDFAFSFPVTHWWGAAFGLAPYSDAGYEMHEQVASNVLNYVENQYIGTGTLSKFFIGNSFYILKNLSVGANVNFLFGNIGHVSYNSFTGTSSTTGATNTVPGAFTVETSDNTRYRNFTFDYGLQYRINLKKDRSLTIGAVFQSPATLAADYYYQKTRIYESYSSDTIDVKNITNGRTKIPGSLGIGVMYDVKDKFSAGIDFKTQDWKKALFLGEKDPNLTLSRTINAGIEYIPDRYSLHSRLAHLSYRLGGYYNQSYVKVNDHQITEYGLTMGLGIPVVNPTNAMRSSMINFSIEVGRKGTTQYDLIQENFVRFNLSFSLYENWFLKRKFD